MDFLHDLSIGFAVTLSFTNLTYCLLGCLVGTLVGILPGLGPSATMAILLPITLTLEPTTSLIMLAGIYYGAQYGGSTTAILVNLPGETSSVVTVLDGHQMARKGRAGAALTIAALGSFVAGTFATLVIAVGSPALSAFAMQFHAVDYFSLMVVGLITSAALANGSLLKALAMIVLGLIVGTIGVDITSGVYRMTFGVPELLDGISVIAAAMGIFGLGEIIENLVSPGESRAAQKTTFRSLLPTREEFRRSIMPVIRGTALGTILGVLPGGGATLSSFAAYAVEKRISKHPERFGTGEVEGLAAPESANNAGAQTSFIPLLTLGLPSNPTIALMAGAMLIQGIQPGPNVINEQPELFWGLIVSMWVGNLMLVILNLPLIGLWIKLLSVPYKYLFPAIMTFCAIGVFTLSNSSFDVYLMLIFGFVGFVLRRLSCEPAPFLLGMILGPIMEEYLRRAMLLSGGDPLVLIQRPISATLLALAAVLLVFLALPSIRKKREEVFQE